MKIINYGNHILPGPDRRRIGVFEVVEADPIWVNASMRKRGTIMPHDEFISWVKGRPMAELVQRVKNRARVTYGVRSAGHLAWVKWADMQSDAKPLIDVLLSEEMGLPAIEEPIVEPEPVVEVEAVEPPEEEEQPKPRRRRRRKAEAAE